MVPIPAPACTGRCPGAKSTLHSLLPVALTAVALQATPWPANGQAERPAPRPDPLHAQAPVPPLVHNSAMATYRRQVAVPLGSWREANDTVTRIGGWRAYTREANQAEAPAAAAPATAASTPMAKPAAPAPTLPSGHGGHHEPETK
ncbi:MAG: hypothetical protein Q7S90_05485 [Rubrivivax sp.]|nr:hypothetical protein [Rubrivivax sp.]